MDPAGRERLYHLLQTAAHRLKTRADRDSQGVAGISAAQAAVMFVIQREGGATQRRVAEQLKLNESAVTAMVGRLMEAGFVDRAPSATDGRAWTVSLTPAGTTALETFRVSLDAMNAEITAALGGEAAVVRFAEGLRALLEIPAARRDPG
ncbi:MarR family winged helix-turn-helix transcriptional regulator [Phenylobacterium sp.]|uniref:MarR family winged helix-turn-helix transcriptional regulator n=1 Tax=Phenylobacterium sp. TaxID=1871053 RepID=UPI00122BEC39|nr:MarR family winged helix-turn-helix transcriptional regulator [Phenylobacterium sp.]TAL32561.1 MAG: MarR family transcriptional regulator [Phenylobacterium sp.]